MGSVNFISELSVVYSTIPYHYNMKKPLQIRWEEQIQYLTLYKVTDGIMEVIASIGTLFTSLIIAMVL